MKKIYRNYIQNFQGLSREIWLLSFVTFINRAGAMVIPFLSLYLVNEKCFTLPQVGIIMTSYGLGSMLGTIIGGKLTDVIGFHKVIILSLLLGGLGFIALQFLDTFYTLCVGVFLLILLADAYRPAVFVAAGAYSKPENVTRGIALIRLAINVGFSIGIVMGGFLIANVSYSSLFWIDGLSCIAASFLLFNMLPQKSNLEIQDETSEQEIKQGVSPYRNGLYILLFIIMVFSSITFIQYFSVLPLYYEEVHLLSEDLIGLLLFVNGVLIIVFEMPLVDWIERLKISKTTAMIWGHVFLALSFIILTTTSWTGIIVIGMILMTIGEMIGSPFSSALALSMAPKGRKGSYMGLFSLSFSLSHLIGHNAGMNIIDRHGYTINWFVMSGILLCVILLSIWLYFLLKKSPDYQDY